MKKGDIVWIEKYSRDIVGFFEITWAHGDLVSIAFDYDYNLGDPSDFETVNVSECRLVCKAEDRADLLR